MSILLLLTSQMNEKSSASICFQLCRKWGVLNVKCTTLAKIVTDEVKMSSLIGRDDGNLIDTSEFVHAENKRSVITSVPNYQPITLSTH